MMYHPNGFPWKDIVVAENDCFAIEESNFGSFNVGYKQYLLKSKNNGECT
jgi:hypothetical protein